MMYNGRAFLADTPLAPTLIFHISFLTEINLCVLWAATIVPVNLTSVVEYYDYLVQGSLVEPKLSNCHYYCSGDGAVVCHRHFRQ